MDFQFDENYKVAGTPEVFQAAVKDGRAVFLMNKTKGAYQKALSEGAEMRNVHLVYEHGDRAIYLNSANLYGVYVMVQSPAHNAAGAKRIIVVPEKKPEPIPEAEVSDISKLKVSELRDMAVAMGSLTPAEAAKMKKSEILKLIS